jgi:hypothetical protein
MADITTPNPNPFFVDKQAIQKIVAEQNERMGFVKDPTATPQKAQEMMLALGIRPEDNYFLLWYHRRAGRGVGGHGFTVLGCQRFSQAVHCENRTRNSQRSVR